MELEKISFKKTFGLLLLIVALVLIFTNKNFSSGVGVLSGDNLEIVFTEEGFVPEVLVVTQGSKVTFVNESQDDFWPASNLHPSHEVYSEFDSLEGISSGESWSFRFDKEGRFEYHDHLASNFTGVILVVEEGKVSVNDTSLNCNDPENLDDSRRASCLEIYMRRLVSEDGIIAGLEVLANNFQHDLLFAENCHSLAHIIGEEAYERFSSGKEFDADERTTYCGYGFYHGFMERLLILENDLNKAKDFCTFLDNKVVKGRGNAQLACLHGVGHGFVDGAEKKAWGDERALTEPALKLCDKITTNAEEEYRCYSGVFNSLSIAYSSNLYDLKINTEDPLWICREQKEERYKLGCYTDMMVALMVLEDDDLAKAVAYLDVVEPEYLDQTMATLSSLAVRQNLDVKSFSHIVEICHSLPKNLQLQCVKGFSGGLMEFGEPKREYIKAVSFCSEVGLSSNERKGCFESIIDYAHFSYPKNRLQSTCDIINYNDMSERVKINCSI